MKLEELVPNIKLCKLIPDGEFGDSCFVWVVNGDYQPKFQVVDKRKYPFIPENGATLYPAPTLQEIFTRLPNMYALNGDFLNPRMFITLRNKEIKKYGLIIPDVALKIWFQTRGIKCEYDL